MSCLNASMSGLELINYHRRLKGWTKQSAMWTSEAGVSEATLKRFWKRDRIRYELFIAIVKAVGITDWQSIAELNPPKIQPSFLLSYLPPIVSYQMPEIPRYYGFIERSLQSDAETIVLV